MKTYIVLYNDCFGGFNVSREAKALIKEKYFENVTDHSHEFRSNPVVVDVFNKLGSKKFSGSYSNIEAKEIPVIYDYRIEEYDGLEKILLVPKEEHLLNLMREQDFSQAIEYLKYAGCFIK